MQTIHSQTEGLPRIDGPTPIQVSGGPHDPGPLPSNELNAAASTCPDVAPVCMASLAVISAGSSNHNI